MKLREPRDLLAVLPYQIGYQPENSLILAAIRRGRSSRLGTIVRFDLPSVARGDLEGDLPIRYALALDRDREADAVVVVLYRDGPAAAEDDGRAAGSGIVDRVAPVLEGAGYEVIDALWVGPEGWGSYLCPDLGCCPPEGRPLVELEASGARAELVFQGRRAAASFADMVALPPVGDEERAAVREAVAAARRARQGSGSGMGDGEARTERFIRGWRSALKRHRTGTPASAALIAEVVLAIRDPRLRDALLVDSTGWARAGAASGDPVVRLARGGTDDACRHLVEGIAGDLDAVPDLRRMGSAKQVLSRCAAAVDEEFRPPVLTMLAWIEWAEGRGSTCAHYLARALELDPGHRLAVLLREISRRGIMPRWVVMPR